MELAGLRIGMQVSLRLRSQSGDQSNRRASHVKLQGVPMSNLTPDHQLMLDTWQQHAHAEFVLKDADAALATMTDNPHVILIPSGTGGNGWASVHAFYANQFLPNIPPDFEFSYVSQIFSDDRIVYELVVDFTHTLRMDWMLPGVPPTGRKVEFILVIIIQIQTGKVASEHF